MKIAHVFPSSAWGGAEIYTVMLAESQMRDGMDVVVWGLPDSPLINEAKKRGVAVLTDYVPYRLGLFSTKKLARVINSEKITHLHCHWSGGPWAFFRIKQYCRIQVIYHIHLWVSYYKGDVLHQYAYKSLNTIVVAGERAKLAALERLPVREGQLRMCPYFMDQSRFANLTDVGWNRTLPENPLIFGMFARIDFQKGVKEFAIALKEVMAKHPNVVAVFVGDPTLGETSSRRYAEEVDRLIQDNPAQDRIFRFPYRADYLNILKNCDVLVAPSYNESYSTVFLDAFALGLPVVSTNAGGTPDLVNLSRGWLIEPQSVRSLTTVLNEIASSPKEEVRRRGRAGFDYVSAQHSRENVLKTLTDIYQTAEP